MRYRRRIQPPTVGDVEAMARLDGIELRDGEAADLLGTIAALVEAAALAVERETIQPAARPFRRDRGRRPSPDEDPYNAFVRCCRVEGEREGPLAGRTVAVKDNIAVAGVPMTEGSLFPPWTSSDDAVVVERVLAAGATIVGALNMDELGGGDRSDELDRACPQPGRPDSQRGRIVRGRRARPSAPGPSTSPSVSTRVAAGGSPQPSAASSPPRGRTVSFPRRCRAHRPHDRPRHAARPQRRRCRARAGSDRRATTGAIPSGCGGRSRPAATTRRRDSASPDWDRGDRGERQRGRLRRVRSRGSRSRGRRRLPKRERSSGASRCRSGRMDSPPFSRSSRT